MLTLCIFLTGSPHSLVHIFWQGGPAFSAIVNVGIEADPSFNLIGRIRGPNVSPGALRLIVNRSLRTFISYLETSFFMSKDLLELCHHNFVRLLLYALLSIPVQCLLIVANSIVELHLITHTTAMYWKTL